MTFDSHTIDQSTAAEVWPDPEDVAMHGGTDLANPQLVAALTVPPCSSVVAIGLGDGVVLRALSARMCRVWGVDADPDAVRTAAPWCEAVLHGDVQTVDLETALAGERCDTILVLDGLHGLPDALPALRRVASFLAPGGRIVFLTSATSDGSRVRLDRASLRDLLAQAGWCVLDDIRIERPIDGCDTGGQSLLIAAPGVEPRLEITPMLAGAALERLHLVEKRQRRLEARARDLGDELSTARAENRDLRAALDEAREWHRQSATSVADGADALRREVRERERLDERLAATMQELEQTRVEQRFLRDDLAVKDAYLASLREESARHADADRQRALAERERELERQQSEQALEAQRARREQEHAAEREQWDNRLRILAQRFDTAVSERAAEADRAAQLEVAQERLRQELVSAHDELHRVHTAIAETLAQPRYVLADRVNSWARRLRIVHRPLKRFWLGRGHS